MAPRITGKVARELTRDEQAALARYTPKVIPAHRWAKIADYTRAAVAEAGVYSTRKVTADMHKIAHYIDWAHNVMGRSRVHEQIFEHELIAYYTVNELTDYSKASRSTTRSTLLWYADLLLPAELRPLTIQRFGRQHRSAPHTAAEVERLKQWANEQHTPFKRHAAWCVLTFGLGAGLRTRELDALRREDVIEDVDGVLVHVRGEDERMVPMLAEWEDAAVVLAECVAPGAFVFKPDRDGPRVKDVGFTLHKSQHKPDFEFNLRKMRTTWLVTLLDAGLPIQAILDAAGVSSVESLTRLLEFVDPLPAQAMREAIRQASHQRWHSMTEEQRLVRNVRARESNRRAYRKRMAARLGGAHGR